MLAVEGILALNHARVIRMAQLFCAVYQRIGHIQMGDGRKFYWHVLLGGAFHADGSGSHHQIAALHRQGHAAAGADADNRIHANLMQLLDADGR